jgi:hypothetical protein
MSDAVAGKIRGEVLKYFKGGRPAVKLSRMAEEIRKSAQLNVRDADVRAVVQPMIATGTLSYAPGLKIQRGSATE